MADKFDPNFSFSQQLWYYYATNRGKIRSRYNDLTRKFLAYNDSEENARKLIAFMHRNDLYEMNLLKFHRLGQTKWEQLGWKYEYSDHGDMEDEAMQKLQRLYLDEEIACYIGDDTPF